MTAVPTRMCIACLFRFVVLSGSDVVMSWVKRLLMSTEVI